VLAGLGKRTAINVGSRTALIRCTTTASQSVGLAQDQVHHLHHHHHQGTIAQLNRTWTMVGRTFRRMGMITSKTAPENARRSAREWATVLAGLGKRTAINVGSRTALIRCTTTASQSVGLAQDQVHHLHHHHHQGTIAQLNRTWTILGRTFRRMGMITSKTAPENARCSAREWATVLAGLGKQTAINAGSKTVLIRCIMTAFRSVGPVSSSIRRGSPQTAPKTCDWKPRLLVAFLNFAISTRSAAKFLWASAALHLKRSRSLF